MDLYKHGNYEEYKAAQIKKNVNKIDKVWAEQAEIDALSTYIKNSVPEVKFGICHGVRNGWEVNRFARNLKAKVIGTEISHTASQFDNVIEWDFHNIKEEWLNAADFVYSNSLDHSYDPEMCIQKWLSCLNGRGICIVQWTHAQSEFPENRMKRKDQADAADCFRASSSEYESMFKKYAQVQTMTSEELIGQVLDKFHHNARWFILKCGG